MGIPDVEGEPELETCDISASGMLLRTCRNAGEPGAVRMLRLVTADLGASIEIMAHVVRVVEHVDVELGRVINATAFEFLPHQPQELEDFLGEVLEGGISVAPAAPSDLPGRARPARVRAPRVSGMVIETNCAVEAGTKVWVEIEMPSPLTAVRLSGRAVESQPIEDAGDDELYRVEVGFGDGEAPSSNRPSRKREGVHLSGALSEVGLPSLLGFFELERASGVLRLEQDSKTAALFVREGCILDVESEPAGASATDALADLLEWPDGAFEFTFQSVERADAIGTPTTALLMECARRSDESSR